MDDKMSESFPDLSRSRQMRKPNRPVWVYFVFGIYLLLVCTVVVGPVALAASQSPPSDLLAAVIFATIVVTLGASLLVIPIGHRWDLPQSQRSIIFPLVGSATLGAILFFGLWIATNEFLQGNIPRDVHKEFGRAVYFCVPVVWLGWMVVFGSMASSLTPLDLSDRLYKTLLAGSVLELLVAIPMHLVVRRRAECCAGFGTGMGIGVGILVMLVALGPAVLFLFYRRYKQVYARRSDAGAD
jgi:hypothetical protein